MYRPNHFQPSTDEQWVQLIKDNPLATVISNGGKNLEISLTPVSINNDHSILEGHFAKKNDILNLFAKHKRATFLFQGPNGYISPSLFISSPHLPTWNYSMVEIQADVTLINDKMEVMVLLNKLTKKFDRNFSHFQRSQDYLDLIDAAAKEVVGFKAKIIDMKAKFKLSQNKQQSDINVLITALRQSGDADRDTLADLIERQLYEQLKT